MGSITCKGAFGRVGRIARRRIPGRIVDPCGAVGRARTVAATGMLERYVRRGTDGYCYPPEVVAEYDDPGFYAPVIEVIGVGPALANALRPSDVRAAGWAAKREP